MILDTIVEPSSGVKYMKWIRDNTNDWILFGSPTFCTPYFCPTYQASSVPGIPSNARRTWTETMLDLA